MLQTVVASLPANLAVAPSRRTRTPVSSADHPNPKDVSAGNTPETRPRPEGARNFAAALREATLGSKGVECNQQTTAKVSPEASTRLGRRISLRRRSRLKVPQPPVLPVATPAGVSHRQCQSRGGPKGKNFCAVPPAATEKDQTSSPSKSNRHSAAARRFSTTKKDGHASAAHSKSSNTPSKAPMSAANNRRLICAPLAAVLYPFDSSV